MYQFILEVSPLQAAPRLRNHEIRTSWTLPSVEVTKWTMSQKGTDVVFYWRIKAVGPYATIFSETKSFTIPAALAK
jgi:hypothetical protein